MQLMFISNPMPPHLQFLSLYLSFSSRMAGNKWVGDGEGQGEIWKGLLRILKIYSKLTFSWERPGNVKTYTELRPARLLFSNGCTVVWSERMSFPFYGGFRQPLYNPQVCKGFCVNQLSLHRNRIARKKASKYSKKYLGQT